MRVKGGTKCAVRHWRICGQVAWNAIGQPLALGAGYMQMVGVARSSERCREPGCPNIIQPGEGYVSFWRGHNGSRPLRGEIYCLAHAPVAVELS